MAFAALLGVGLAAQPAEAQYHVEGDFTVTPVNIIRGNGANVQGWCENGSNVDIKLDGGATVGSGTVPGVPDPPFIVTTQVTIPITIPPLTTIGAHTLHVYCHGDLIQILNINVLGQSCNTGGSYPVPNGGVYGSYGGDTGNQSRPPAVNSSFNGLVKSATTLLPMPYATVVVLNATTGQPVGPVTLTDANGYYAYSTQFVTPNKPYKVRVVELGFTTIVSSTYNYTGSPITVDLNLSPAPASLGVQGHVTDQVTGQDLKFVSVRLWLVDSASRYIATATDVNGNYTFVGVPQGDYVVQFAVPGYATEWWNEVTTKLAASVISLDGIGMSTANATLSGICKGNPVLVDFSRPATDGDGPLVPMPVLTGMVIALMAASLATLRGSKRRVARSRQAR